ncbi:hypothetical protein C9374_004997 [Naegleria lovaniensis]|uniref:SAP domain-containing protein n=1 Tax=Naegleria lovaniensis TaxID=51637 RepID=A0AA88KKY1_NAELO|nr:uncharacterized protein C9374_004997 [Naegleria lovaniensis]KAG2383030.1 hypothetical protein C9374_004997 [Naegleria lovaniensis]
MSSSDENPPSIESVLEQLPLNLLKEYIQGNDIKAKKTAKKTDAVEAILEHAQKKGESAFIKELEKDALKLALEELSGDEKVNTESKSKMTKSFKTLFQKAKNKEEFFNSCSIELLTKFLAALGMEEDSSKEEKAEAVQEEILITGLKIGFNTMSKEYINDVCEALKVAKSGSKKACISRIIGQAYPHYLETTEKETKEREKNDISQIKKGITFEELYQYYAEELQDYCKQNGLKKTGSKKIVCKRILKFLEGDLESTRPLKPGERLKKKRGGKKGQKRKGETEEGKEEEKKEEEGESKKKKTKK